MLKTNLSADRRRSTPIEDSNRIGAIPLIRVCRCQSAREPSSRFPFYSRSGFVGVHRRIKLFGFRNFNGVFSFGILSAGTSTEQGNGWTHTFKGAWLRSHFNLRAAQRNDESSESGRL